MNLLASKHPFDLGISFLSPVSFLSLDFHKGVGPLFGILPMSIPPGENSEEIGDTVLPGVISRYNVKQGLEGKASTIIN